MDKTDAKLLHLLAKDADIPASALVSRLNLSVPAINKRIAKLKNSGVIRRSTILTEPREVGKPIQAYVLVVMESFSNAGSLQDYVQADPDVLECSAVTGEYDFILKLCAADVAALENKLLELKKRRGIAKSHTMLVLQEHKFAPTALPCMDGKD